MVQWLGFYPSKVEVGVRFTVVALNFWVFLGIVFPRTSLSYDICMYFHLRDIIVHL